METCPLCRRGEMRAWLAMPIDPKKEEPTPYGRVFRCPSCGFGAVLPRPREDEVGDFYRLDRYYTHGTGTGHFAGPGRVTWLDRARGHLAWRLDRGRTFSPEMARELVGGTAADACDVGCGGGGMAARLQAGGFRVVGVEVDPGAIETARGLGVEVHPGTAEHWPASLDGRQFDLISLIHVLEHCLDPVAAVTAAAARLKPGGHFVAELPNADAAGFAWSGVAWEPLDVPRHLNFFQARTLSAVCRLAGLEVVSVYYGNYLRQFSNDWVNTERRICEAVARSGAAAEPTPRPNSRGRAWRLLAATAFAPAARKYDSLGIVARKP